MKRPAGAGQADARTGFSGAIPKTKGGDLYCEGVGATCEADKVHQDEAAEAKADAVGEKKEAEVTKEAEKIVEGEKAKAEKKEKGEGPKEEAPEEPAAEKPAAFVQSKHHHKKQDRKSVV